MYPAVSLSDFKRRTVIPSSGPSDYVALVEALIPGFTLQRILSWQSRVYAQLRKLYGKGLVRGTTPLFGGAPSQPLASGTLPPSVTLSGVPLYGSVQEVIQIVLPGILGVATFKHSEDGGNTFSAPILTPATFPIPNTGLTATFSAVGSFSADNVYSAATPVPEAIIGWIVDLVSRDVLRKHGVNTQDPQISQVFERATEALSEIDLAANSETGLFDLPVNDDSDTSRSTGGPLAYTETSPYVGADIQEANGVQEDLSGTDSNIPSGTTFGS